MTNEQLSKVAADIASKIVAHAGADMVAHGERAIQLTVNELAASLHKATKLPPKTCGAAAKRAIFEALAARFGVSAPVTA